MREKLVRDRLDCRILAEERRVETDPQRMEELLRRKLEEELAELRESGYADVSEFADVIEVLRALAALPGIAPGDIEDVRREKAQERGGFARGLVYVPLR